MSNYALALSLNGKHTPHSSTRVQYTTAKYTTLHYLHYNTVLLYNYPFSIDNTYCNFVESKVCSLLLSIKGLLLFLNKIKLIN